MKMCRDDGISRWCATPRLLLLFLWCVVGVRATATVSAVSTESSVGERAISVLLLKGFWLI